MTAKLLLMAAAAVLVAGIIGCSESDESDNGSGDTMKPVDYIGEATESTQLEWTVDQIKAIDNSYDYMAARVAVYAEELEVLYKIKDQETADLYKEELREIRRKDREISKIASKYGTFSADGPEAEKYLMLLRQASDLSGRLGAENTRIIEDVNIDIPDDVWVGSD